MPDLLAYEPETPISPIIRDAFFDALNPKSSTAIAVKEDGSVAIKANQPPPEAKPEKAEGEGVQLAGAAKPTTTPGAQPTQPTQPFTGFGPAIAALMAAPTGGVSAATLTGLTPEQITGLLNVESAKQRMRQGTIEQLLGLPYKQALTAKALRPGEQPLPLGLRTRAAEALISQRLREPTKPRTLTEAKELKAAPGAPAKYPQGDWWRSPAGDIKFYDKGEDVPRGWERVPSREQVPPRESVYEKTIAIKALDTLRSYTHDVKTGKLLDVPDVTGISALNETLGKEGKEVVGIRMPSTKRKWAGIDWLKKDLAGQMVYVIVEEGGDATDAEVKDALVSAYGYTPEEADAVIRLKRGK